MGCLGNEERVLGFKERVGVVGKEGSERSHGYGFKGFKGIGILKHWSSSTTSAFGISDFSLQKSNRYFIKYFVKLLT